MPLYGPSRPRLASTDDISWAQNVFGGCPLPLYGPAHSQLFPLIALVWPSIVLAGAPDTLVWAQRIQN